jgi:hypothetical protein
MNRMLYFFSRIGSADFYKLDRSLQSLILRKRVPHFGRRSKHGLASKFAQSFFRVKVSDENEGTMKRRSSGTALSCDESRCREMARQMLRARFDQRSTYYSAEVLILSSTAAY